MLLSFDQAIWKKHGSSTLNPNLTVPIKPKRWHESQRFLDQLKVAIIV
tara:strand:+ start:228 stop:371 length:144 start_codon:yes stop_codon:yes gene_type:complete